MKKSLRLVVALLLCLPTLGSAQDVVRITQSVVLGAWDEDGRIISLMYDEHGLTSHAVTYEGGHTIHTVQYRIDGNNRLALDKKTTRTMEQWYQAAPSEKGLMATTQDSLMFTATTEGFNEIVVSDMRTGCVIHTVRLPRTRTTLIAVHPNGNRMAVVVETDVLHWPERTRSTIIELAITRKPADSPLCPAAGTAAGIFLPKRNHRGII